MVTNKGIGGHHAPFGRTDDWFTPPEILKPLGAFDLDPCTSITRPWDTARVHYTIEDDGLSKQWFDRVWMNPPYSRDVIGLFMKRMGEHGNGIALVFARTETVFFQRWVFPLCDSILFLEGRLNFCNTAGIRSRLNAGAPSVLIAYGHHNVECLGDSGLKGKHLLVNVAPVVVVAISPSWKSVVTIALTRLNGEANLKAIYDVVATIAPDKLARNSHYEAKVRQTLQKYFNRINKGQYAKTIDN